MTLKVGKFGIISFLGRNWKKIAFSLYTIILIRLIFMYNVHMYGKEETKTWNWHGFSQSQMSSLSNLGQVLYLNRSPPAAKEKSFTILVHKYGQMLERRHILNFGKERIDPFAACPVNNCRLTYDPNELPGADAVLIHMHRTCKLADLPKQDGPRPSHQRWIFLTDESPKNAMLCRNYNLKDFDGVFNWSMSYRYDADIPVAYGRTVMRSEPIEDSIHEFNIDRLLKNKTELAAIMISNCASTSLRWRYVKELSKHMPLAIIGGCGNKTVCGGPVHYGRDCAVLERFKFYLSFENSLCDQYVTEKLWWNALGKGAIPVVMGGDADGTTYSEFLPPGSYLNVDDFDSPEDLANFLKAEAAVEENLRSYHTWRRDFEVLQEHAYFGSTSVHYCRICQALNYNSDLPKVYQNFEAVLARNRCRTDLNHPLI